MAEKEKRVLRVSPRRKLSSTKATVELDNTSVAPTEDLIYAKKPHMGRMSFRFMDFDNGEATFLQASSSRIPLSFDNSCSLLLEEYRRKRRVEDGGAEIGRVEDNLGSEDRWTETH
uniref:Uncharacterized protein At2g12170 n=1 Tax=Arabidopsis thaliana TaxID=3702 RepID=Q9ZUQ7_ARATH|nr:hypothetical protein [Arabidopsis thaliana]AAM15360.1 hypothetical protein [Arabidopsis thaliana]